MSQTRIDLRPGRRELSPSTSSRSETDQSPWMFRFISALFPRPSSLPLSYPEPRLEPEPKPEPEPLGQVLDLMMMRKDERRMRQQGEATETEWSGLVSSILHWLQPQEPRHTPSPTPSPEAELPPYPDFDPEEEAPRPLLHTIESFEVAYPSLCLPLAPPPPSAALGVWGTLWGKIAGGYGTPRPPELYGRPGLAYEAPPTHDLIATRMRTKVDLKSRLNNIQGERANNNGDYYYYTDSVFPEWSGLDHQTMADTQGSELSDPGVAIKEKPAELFHHIRHPCVDAPEQDYGYSSLEEEHNYAQQAAYILHSSEIEDKSEEKRSGNTGDLNTCEVIATEHACVLQGSVDLTMTSDSSEATDGKVPVGYDEWDSDSDSEDDEKEEASSPSLPRPKCSNKTIAYILGGNSSDEESEDEEDKASDCEDDGFDSKTSSDFTDSDCSSDETEKLWNSFSSSWDPYNPFNFQACIKTTKRQKKALPENPELHLEVTSGSTCPQNLLCSLEGNDAPLESGFSEAVHDELREAMTQLTLGRKVYKKVAFDEHVIEYYVSSEEIRKGPWEEYARDRCRFQRRIRETEESIGYCFTFKHRQSVLEKLLMDS